jgi:hypothetical protein
MQGGNSVFNWLGGITMIVLVGVVVSNGKNVANILNGIAKLYSTAAGSAQAASPAGQH